MNNLVYHFRYGDTIHTLTLVFVQGTGSNSFLFGTEDNKQPITIKPFYIGAYTVTQALWQHIMGSDEKRAQYNTGNHPAEHVSWYDITANNGFLERINSSIIMAGMQHQLPAGALPLFRLPSETEWEYAARGGVHWRDGFTFSGSATIDDVAWYKDNSGNHTWPVGQKAANQLGIYDMCGNIWEWCEDWYTRDTSVIPKDGSPFLAGGQNKVLRGGCHHNWKIHCTVDKRYEITPDAFDGCIGFRLALSF